jgi:Sec-independent protein translocase protein TatA
MKKLFLLIPILVLSSCSSFQVFEKKVPDPIKKTKDHLDNEKNGAYYLAINSNNQNKALANVLSRSIGTPKTIEDNPELIKKNLLDNCQEYESNIYGLNKELINFQGKDIKGSGFNLFPFISSFGIIVIVALLILFPSLASVLFFILRRTKKAFENVVKGVQEFSKDDPEASKKLQDLLEKKLDRTEKILKGKVEAL